MALHKGFDPSKQFKVVKGFHEGGRKYVEGDTYNPRTRVGKTKVLFRHFVAGRVKPVIEEKKNSYQPLSKPVEDSSEKDQDIKTADEGSRKSESPAPKKRGRKKSTNPNSSD